MKSTLPFHFVISPISTGRVTKGKIYRVEKFIRAVPSGLYGRTFLIRLDDRSQGFCLEKRCSYLDERDWILVNFEENLKKILE